MGEGILELRGHSSQGPALPIQIEAQAACLLGIRWKCLPGFQPWLNPAPSVAERSGHHEVKALAVLMLLALLASSMECSIGDLDRDGTLDMLVAQDAKGLDPG